MHAITVEEKQGDELKEKAKGSRGWFWGKKVNQELISK